MRTRFLPDLLAALLHIRRVALYANLQMKRGPSVARIASLQITEGHASASRFRRRSRAFLHTLQDCRQLLGRHFPETNAQENFQVAARINAQLHVEVLIFVYAPLHIEMV